MNGFLVIANDIDPAVEDEFQRWYHDEHLDQRLAVPGFLSARRYLGVEAAPRYAALYETESTRSPTRVIETPAAISVVVDQEIWPSEAYQCHPLVNTSTVVLTHAGLQRFLERTTHPARVLAVPEG